MKPHDGSRESGRLAPVYRSFATAALALACLTFGLSATVAVAAPVAPVISGPTAIQFAYHPQGFRSVITWDVVPTAVEYRVYHADTDYYVGSVTGTSCVVYGMQGYLYHHYVVAVDSTGATSSPSNLVDIRTTAPVPPEAPAGFNVIPMSAFGVQTSTAPQGDIPVKIPYNPAYVTGDPTALRLMHYTGSSWVDVTTSVDTSRSFVFGTASPTSVFAVMEPSGAILPPVAPPVAPPVDPIVETPAVPVAPIVETPTVPLGPIVSPTTPPVAPIVASPTPVSAVFATDPIRLATSTRMAGPSSVRVRHKLSVTGKVSPIAAPGTVTIVRSRRVGGRWVGARSTRVRVTNGSYRYSFTPMKRGAWRLVATFNGTTVGSTTYTRSASVAKRVRVK